MDECSGELPDLSGALCVLDGLLVLDFPRARGGNLELLFCLITLNGYDSALLRIASLTCISF